MDGTGLSAEDLGYWFFRLNGCLTIRDFVVHREGGGRQRTDADIIATRFPHRQEMDMVDHRIFSPVRVGLYFVEVKSSGACRLNGPWSNPGERNLSRALRAVGAHPRKRVEIVANKLHAKGACHESSIDCRLVAVAALRNRELERSHPEAIQLTWSDIAQFIYERLQTYEIEKAHHPQWDSAGHRLYALARKATYFEFAQAVALDFAVTVREPKSESPPEQF